MRRTIAQARKELTQLFRDRLTILLALVLPLMLMPLLSITLSLSVNDLPVVIRDFDQSALSRRYAETFRSSLTFRVVPEAEAGRDEDALRRGTARAVVIIPEHFGLDLRRGLRPDVQVLLDGTDANTAELARGHLEGLTRAFAASLNAGAQRGGEAVELQTRFWYNPGRRAVLYVAPAAFCFVLAVFTPLMAALAMAREAEQKTILQVYASGVGAHEYVLGKVLAYYVIAALEWLSCLLLMVAAFGMRPAGDPTPMLVGTVFYLACCVGMGLALGVLIPNQAAAIQASALAAFVLAFFLSGFIFPVGNMPDSVRWLADFVPTRYYIELVRDAFLSGGGWRAMWRAPVWLAALSVMFFSLAWLRLRRMRVRA